MIKHIKNIILVVKKIAYKIYKTCCFSLVWYKIKYHAYEVYYAQVTFTYWYTSYIIRKAMYDDIIP